MQIYERKRHKMGEAARLLDVHVSTLWRWRLRGVRGHKLRTVVIGGTRYVLEEDLKAFLHALNQGEQPREDDRAERAAAADAALDALGVKAID